VSLYEDFTFVLIVVGVLAFSAAVLVIMDKTCVFSTMPARRNKPAAPHRQRSTGSKVPPTKVDASRSSSL